MFLFLGEVTFKWRELLRLMYEIFSFVDLKKSLTIASKLCTYPISYPILHMQLLNQLWVVCFENVQYYTVYDKLYMSYSIIYCLEWYCFAWTKPLPIIGWYLHRSRILGLKVWHTSPNLGFESWGVFLPTSNIIWAVFPPTSNILSRAGPKKHDPNWTSGPNWILGVQFESYDP